MDRNQKFIKKLSAKEYQKVKDVLKQILSGNFIGLDIKKLRGLDELYRVRIGRIRIIFYAGEQVVIKQISSRDDNTYNDF